MNRPPRPSAPDEAFRPIRLIEVELSEPLPAVSAVDPATGLQSAHAVSLVRLHTLPLGLVTLSIGEDGMSPDQFSQRIRAVLGPRIAEHLQRDGISTSGRLGGSGLPAVSSPPCLEERDRVLANAPFVSVVVPTHNRPELIRTCLEALSKLEYPSYEVIVVDNAPATPEIAAEVEAICAARPVARYVREDRPGASWARNRGVIESRAEIIAFTDDDVLVDRYWLLELVKAIQSEENVGCATGNVLPRRLDTPSQAWFEERGGFSRGFVRHVYDSVSNRPRNALYPYSAMMFGSGNSMAFRSSILRAIGGFDPALDPASPSRGGEDLSAFFEVIVRGHKLVYEPAAIVRHLHRRDFAGLRQQMYSWGVGFSAYLTRSLLAHPRLLPDFAVRLPYALAILLKGRIPYGLDEAQRLERSFPDTDTRDLWRVEHVGYLHGTMAYLKSLRRARRIVKEFGRLDIRASGQEINRATIEGLPSEQILAANNANRE